MEMSKNPNSRVRNASLENDFQSVQKRQRAIGRHLRNLFDDVVAEGVPGEFEDLLDRLRDREEAAGGTSREGPRKAVGRGTGEIRVLAGGPGDAH